MAYTRCKAPLVGGAYEGKTAPCSYQELEACFASLALHVLADLPSSRNEVYRPMWAACITSELYVRIPGG